jgi:release factor glutamine methyltransferase
MSSTFGSLTFDMCLGCAGRTTRVIGFGVPVSATEVVARLRAAGCVFAEDEARLLIASTTSPAALSDAIARRVAGEPLEQILGWAEFRGLRIAVASGVFVPRQRSEFLVSIARSYLQDTSLPERIVVDLCCGSGAVGVALVSEVDGVELHAADIDPAAVRCARRNLDAIGGTASDAGGGVRRRAGGNTGGGSVYLGDLDAPLPTCLHGRVRVLVANAPYVPTDSIALMPPEARLHEPLIALDGGDDGLDIARRVATVAPRWLAPGGHVLIETSTSQAPLLADTMRHNGLIASIAESDEFDATVVIGCRADAPGRK